MANFDISGNPAISGFLLAGCGVTDAPEPSVGAVTEAGSAGELVNSVVDLKSLNPLWGALGSCEAATEGTEGNTPKYMGN